MRYLNVSLRPSLPFGLLRSLRVQGFNTRRAPVHAITVGDEPQARQAYDLNGNRAKSCGISVPRPILSGGAGERREGATAVRFVHAAIAFRSADFRLRRTSEIDRAIRGVTPALSACRRPLHRRLVETEKPTASPRRSPETRGLIPDPIVAGIAGCCACSAMNSRRVIRSPRRRVQAAYPARRGRAPWQSFH